MGSVNVSALHVWYIEIELIRTRVKRDTDDFESIQIQQYHWNKI